MPSDETNPLLPDNTPKTSENERHAWRVNAKRMLAAKLVNEDEITNAEIAARVGISERQLGVWKGRPEFKKLCADLLADFRARVLNRGYCRKEQRVIARSRLVDKYLAIMEERAKKFDEAFAADPNYKAAAGARTGLVTVIPRSIRVSGEGGAADYKTFDEEIVDTDMENAIRANLREIAQEVGDWNTPDKTEQGNRLAELFEVMTKGNAIQDGVLPGDESLDESE